MTFGRQHVPRRYLAVALMVLSIAVVNWGLQYKMSLYHADASSHAPAKFWTGRSDVAITESEVSTNEKAPSGTALLFLLLSLFLLGPFSFVSLRVVGHRPNPVSPRIRETFARYQALFLRPPPLQF